MSTADSPLTHLTHVALSLDALNCGAMLLGRSGAIAHANPRLCVMVGRPLQEVVGARLIDLYGPAGPEVPIAVVFEQFDRAWDAETNLPVAHGGTMPVVASARVVGRTPPLNDYLVVTLIDITHQKLAELRLREQNDRIAELNEMVMSQAESLREYADGLERKVEVRTRELHDAHMEAIYMLAIASEAKDADTGDHVRRVQKLAQSIAVKLGMPMSDAVQLGYAAILHDVGKIHTPDGILKKPGPLTVEERAQMRLHTLAGERILLPSAYFAQAGRIARSHHENWNGTGYPDNLEKRSIPIEARIVRVADVFDALTHVRVYKAAWPVAQAIDEIRDGAGKCFDPDVVMAFDSLIKEAPIG